MNMSYVLCEKPHAVLVPYPVQGHITPMLKLAKLLHSHGFRITFVNTDFNNHRLLRSQGAIALAGLPDFQFEAIPDSMPPSDLNATQDLRALCASIQNNFLLSPLIKLLEKLNSPSSGVPRVTQIVSDGMMSFCFDAGNKLGIPVTAFWTASACGLMGYLHFKALVERGITPLKGHYYSFKFIYDIIILNLPSFLLDESYISNGYLETTTDWIPEMKNIRLKDLPSFLRTMDPDDILFDFLDYSARRISEAKAVIMNTLDVLERPVLDALSSQFRLPIYTIGPINLLSRRFPSENPLLECTGSNLWKEDASCLEWLDSHNPRSVVFVNFGSVTVMSNEQLVEFALGLANCGYNFLWVIRGDLVKGEGALLPPEFMQLTKERGLIVNWCAQEKVLLHPAVGVFLTHGGWNSMLETLCAGVPIMCWPFFAEQPTNCRYACTEWGIGMEIDNDVKRKEVERLTREMMVGEKGKEMRKKAVEWKDSTIRAIENGGSSIVNFERVVKEILL